MAVRHLPLVGLALAFPLLAGACAAEKPAGRDRPEEVFRSAMAAVSSGDFEALASLLTNAGHRGLEERLRALQASLGDPVTADHLLGRVRERRGPVAPAEIERARTGTLRDAWDFLLRADPRPRDPPVRSSRTAPDGRTVTLDYEDPGGTLRAVRLVLTPRGWAVDHIDL